MKYIKNEKLEKIQLTKNNFYVVLDFDRTITAEESADSWDVAGELLDVNFQKELANLYQKYRPIELDYEIPLKEKIKAMETWYQECMDLYQEHGLTKEKLTKAITNNQKMQFRKGAKEFLEKMAQEKIPVIILSAGIGNVIEGFLRKNQCDFENLWIISNFIEFEEDGTMKKFTAPMIHTMNKTMNGHLPRKWMDRLKKIPYKLLLGDLIEDKNMIEKEEWENTILIAFLNQETKDLQCYLEEFDVVLTKEDATFFVVEELIK